MTSHELLDPPGEPTEGPGPGTLEVFIPFWGNPELLYATVASVKAQTDPAWTITVVDDHYPDSSVAEHFAAETDARIRYVRNETNLGITDNYQRCRDLASGELMMFMGCDDLMHPTFVETVKSAHRQFPDAATIQVAVQVIDEHDTRIDPLTDRVKRGIRGRVHRRTELHGEQLAISLLRGAWHYWPALVFRTDRLSEYAFREGLPIIQDLALLIDMTAGGESLVLDPTECFSYRRHTQSASATSLLHGNRFSDERRYYASAAQQMAEHGWSRAARTARLRWTSRLHAVTLLPTALVRREGTAVRSLLAHTWER